MNIRARSLWENTGTPEGHVNHKMPVQNDGDYNCRSIEEGRRGRGEERQQDKSSGYDDIIAVERIIRIVSN